MTAEISILNRNAVALAAESAVTLQTPEGPKIYQANKLFALSKYEPVGVMVYGSAELMTAPWETIIKQFRADLGKTSYPHLEGYANGLLDYVEKCVPAADVARQQNFAYQFLTGWFRRVLRPSLKNLLDEIMKKGPVTDAEVREHFRLLFNFWATNVRKDYKTLQRISKLNRAAMLRRYRAPIRDAAARELQKLADVIATRRMEKFCFDLLMSNMYWHGESGVVIAGYGTDQFFPSLRAYKMDGIFGDRLRVTAETAKNADIDAAVSASVIPFAQSEMVSLFMDGIDGEFANFIISCFEKIASEGYPSVTAKLIGKKLPKGQRDKLLNKLRGVSDQVVKELSEAMHQFSRHQFSDPIVGIVNHLPKEELAAMAEALVNLTSFKRHVTTQAETVGGPIDVAVISRGDGLVWIKRKHYFDKRLNEHFLANYYYDTVRKASMSGRSQ